MLDEFKGIREKKNALLNVEEEKKDGIIEDVVMNEASAQQ